MFDWKISWIEDNWNVQTSDDRKTEEQTSDNTFDENKNLTNCLMVAFDEILADENFLLCSMCSV